MLCVTRKETISREHESAFNSVTIANTTFCINLKLLFIIEVSVCVIRAVHVQDLQEDRIPDSMVLPSFTELQDVIGFPQYFEEAERYSIHGTGAHSATSSNANTSSQPNNSPTDSSNGNKSGKVDAEKQPEGSTSGSRAAENASSTDARAAAEGTWTTSGAFRSFAESATSGTAGVHLVPCFERWTSKHPNLQ